MKNIFYFIILILCANYLNFAYSLSGDFNTGIGIANYTNNGNNLIPSTQQGYSFNASYLFLVRPPIAARLSFVVGPRIKYEAVSGTENGITVDFSTLQFGPEAGLKFTLSPNFDLFNNIYLTYGIYNTLNANVVLLGLSYNVSGSWQAGLSEKLFYNFNNIIGVGGSVEYGLGHYNYSGNGVNGTNNYD